MAIGCLWGKQRRLLREITKTFRGRCLLAVRDGNSDEKEKEVTSFLGHD